MIASLNQFGAQLLWESTNPLYDDWSADLKRTFYCKKWMTLLQQFQLYILKPYTHKQKAI